MRYNYKSTIDIDIDIDWKRRQNHRNGTTAPLSSLSENIGFQFRLERVQW